MIAISNYDYLRPVEKLTFPDIPFYNIKGAYFSNQAAEKRIIWKDPNSDHVQKFRDLFAKIKLGKTQKDIDAYTEILDIFKSYPKSQLEPLSKLLYGDKKGDVLFKEIQDSLEKDVDMLKVKEAESGWGDLSKKYHSDYLVETPVQFMQRRTEELAINNQDKEFITKLIAEINVELSSSEIKNNLELKIILIKYGIRKMTRIKLLTRYWLIY